MFGYDYAVLISEIEAAIETGELDLDDTVFIERDEKAILDYYPIINWQSPTQTFTLQSVTPDQLETVFKTLSEALMDDFEPMNVEQVLKEMKQKSARLNALISIKH